MQNTKNKVQIVCRAYITNTESELLLVKKTSSTFWSLPGGKLDDEDVSMQDCLKREMLEELHAEIEIGKVLHTLEIQREDIRYVEIIWDSKLKSDLKTDKENIQQISNKELEDVQWFDKNTIKEIDFKPAFLKQFYLNNIL
jgi:ADP-ribose pyrophosphatase YjhB (NUDIX family)